jgi:sterol 3beta-glucosyltransferase
VELDVDRSAQIMPNLFSLDTQAESDIDQSCEIHSRDVPSCLNIAILIVGTRGDVQPFVAIGKRLKVSIDPLRLLYGNNGCIYYLPLLLI